MLNAVKLSKLTILCTLLSIFIWLLSCEPEMVNPEEEDTPLTGKPVKVYINLIGAEFKDYKEVTDTEAQTSRKSLSVQNPQQIISKKYYD